MNFYITGDIHSNVADLNHRVSLTKIVDGDCLILLGDVGVNFTRSLHDTILKEQFENKNITYFCIHGNHEIRPSNISSYKIKEWNGGRVYYEEEYPYLLFAIDGEIYNLNNKKTLVCGGAYSVDKYGRVFRAVLSPAGVSFPKEVILAIDKLYYHQKISREEKAQCMQTIDKYVNTGEYPVFWWPDEQPSEAIKDKVEERLQENDWKIDAILTHTSPMKYEPTEVFLKSVDQSFVDKSTEKWLDYIEEKLDYGKWYAGHYHTDKAVNKKFTFLYKKIRKFA